jgi:epoxyqueuosine reductase
VGYFYIVLIHLYINDIRFLSKIQLHTKKIKQKAIELGFSAIGISKANFLEDEAKVLKKWLDKGFHGEMKYMENHFEKRTNPRKLIEGAKSIVSVLYNYFPKEIQIKDTYQISKYAYGKDYHYVVKEKLNLLFDFINNEITKIEGRAFVDSAPVMDKVWAAKSGLGWIGKEYQFDFNKEFGSYVFIGELIIDLELEYDKSIKDYCGNCVKCIDACPTNALSPYELDARKCISYLTIEKKGEIPEKLKGKWDNWIFGCDICQDVCPWNTKLKPHKEDQFKISDLLQNLKSEDWHKLQKSDFKKIFKNSPVKRTKFEGLKRNIDFVNEIE